MAPCYGDFVSRWRLRICTKFVCPFCLTPKMTIPFEYSSQIRLDVRALRATKIGTVLWGFCLKVSLSDDQKTKLHKGFRLDVRALCPSQNWHHAMRISSQTHVCVSKIAQNFYIRASSQEPASTRREGRRPESRYTRAGGASD